MVFCGTDTSAVRSDAPRWGTTQEGSVPLTPRIGGHRRGGGGVDGAGSFDFAVTYSVPERQIGHLEVYEEDVSDGEGFPPGRNVVPLVLNP